MRWRRRAERKEVHTHLLKSQVTILLLKHYTETISATCFFVSKK
jgi:hypothetical protein